VSPQISVFSAVSSAFTFKFFKSADTVNIFFQQKCNLGIQNAELDDDFKAGKKVAEEVINKKLTEKIEFFDF
jgi:hypothetical protein